MELYVVDFIHAHPLSEFSQHLRNEIEFHWIQRLCTILLQWTECQIHRSHAEIGEIITNECKPSSVKLISFDIPQNSIASSHQLIQYDF